MMLKAWSPAYGSIGILCEREEIMWILLVRLLKRKLHHLGVPSEWMWGLSFFLSLGFSCSLCHALPMGYIELSWDQSDRDTWLWTESPKTTSQNKPFSWQSCWRGGVWSQWRKADYHAGSCHLLQKTSRRACQRLPSKWLLFNKSEITVTKTMAKRRLGNRPALVITKCYVWYRIMVLYLNDRCVQFICTSGSSSSQSINTKHIITIAKKSFANGNFDSSLLIFQAHDWTLSIRLCFDMAFPHCSLPFRNSASLFAKFTKNYSQKEITERVRGTLCENFFLRRSLKSQKASLWTSFTVKETGNDSYVWKHHNATQYLGILKISAANISVRGGGRESQRVEHTLKGQGSIFSNSTRRREQIG